MDQAVLFIHKICDDLKMSFGILRRINMLAFLLLTGCVMVANTRDDCKIIDPDLAQGTYSGSCRDGLADGYGEVKGTSSYRGDFRAGKKHGKGIKVMPNGDRYAGDFSDDYRQGRGVYIWGKKAPWAGDRYEGEYRRDQRHGWGVFQWGSGDRYEGPWQNDLRMGPSALESRRTQAAAATAKAVKAGESLCAIVRPDLVSRQHVRGRVEDIAGETVQLRIVEVEGGVASYQGRVVKAGDVLSDRVVNWQLCRQD